MNIANFAGVSEIATNRYRHELMIVDGSRYAAIDSFDNEYFSLSVDWTQRELDSILQQFRVPDWGKERVTKPMGRKRVYMLLGTNHKELMAKKAAWSKIGGDPHFASPNLELMKSTLSDKFHIIGTPGIDPLLFSHKDGPSVRVSKRTYDNYMKYYRKFMKEDYRTFRIKTTNVLLHNFIDINLHNLNRIMNRYEIHQNITQDNIVELLHCLEEERRSNFSTA